MRKIISYSPLILMIIMCVLLTSRLLDEERNLDKYIFDDTITGNPLPNFAIDSFSGEGLSSEKIRQKEGYKLVVFFASWCVPCLAEHKTLMEIAKKKELTIYGINWKDKASDVYRWFRRAGNPYKAIGIDKTAKTSVLFGVTGVPESFLVDRRGYVIYRHNGPLDMKRYIDEIKPLMED